MNRLNINSIIGAVVDPLPTLRVPDQKIGVVSCPNCQFEFVKYTDERDLGVKQGGIPYQLVGQSH